MFKVLTIFQVGEGDEKRGGTSRYLRVVILISGGRTNIYDISDYFNRNIVLRLK